MSAIDALYNEPIISYSSQGGLCRYDNANAIRLEGTVMNENSEAINRLKQEVATIRGECDPAVICELKETINRQNTSLRELRSEVAEMRNICNSLMAINQINKIKNKQ